MVSYQILSQKQHLEFRNILDNKAYRSLKRKYHKQLFYKHYNGLSCIKIEQKSYEMLIDDQFNSQNQTMSRNSGLLVEQPYQQLDMLDKNPSQVTQQTIQLSQFRSESQIQMFKKDRIIHSGNDLQDQTKGILRVSSHQNVFKDTDKRVEFMKNKDIKKHLIKQLFQRHGGASMEKLNEIF
ncbi:hypothetical protein pb186bvf_009045 [Paramecium bursaria]